MTTFYLVDVTEDNTLLFIENKVIVNAHVDTCDAYDLFELTVENMAKVMSDDVVELVIEGDGTKHMINDLLEREEEADAIELILKYGKRK